MAGLSTPANTGDNSSDDLQPSPVRKIHARELREKILRGTRCQNPPNVEALQQEIRDWLTAYRLLDCCVAVKNSFRTKACCCNGDLPDAGSLEFDSICRFLWTFALMTKERQTSFVVEWIRYQRKYFRCRWVLTQEEQIRCWIVPGTPYQACCRDTLMRLLGFGYKRWMGCVHVAEGKTTGTHGGLGNKNHSKVAMNESLEDFFQEMKALACPRATLLVRQLVGDRVELTARDEDDEKLELPSATTKRSLYGRYLRDRGYKYLVNVRGCVSYNQPIPEMEQQTVCSWSKFHAFWKKNYPKLVIAGQREDVCNECYTYINRHKFMVERMKKNEARKEAIDQLNLSGDTEEDEDDPATEVAMEVEQEGEENAVEEQPTQPAKKKLTEEEKREEEKKKLMEEQEEMLLQAAKHVQDAQIQREFFQQEKAISRLTKDKPPSERHLCFVADYAQNMGIPHFGSEQPGETYYYSPLNTFCFGVVDCANDHLHGYIYTEDTAKKGGNNVASMLWLHLKRLGVLDTKEPFKEITFVFDNCPGQNKNRMVIRMMFFLIKLGVAKLVRANFLIRGHTKNDCDRLFNLMKQRYRKANVYTPEDLMLALKHPSVTPVWCGRDVANVFYDWDKLEQKLLYVPDHVTSHHVFTFDATVDNGNFLITQYTQESYRVYTCLLKKMLWKKIHAKNKQSDDDSVEAWKSKLQELEPIPPTGIRDIKWIELYDKWRPLVPYDKRQQLPYFKEDPGNDRREKVKQNTKDAKETRKKRTTTKNKRCYQGCTCY